MQEDSTLEIVNAVIESVSLGAYDGKGSCLTAWLHLSYDGSGQGFGGYALYLPKSWKHHAIESPAGHFIQRCLDIADVTEWSKLPGKTIRVKKPTGWGGTIKGIGHIIKDDWFYPEVDFAKAREGAVA